MTTPLGDFKPISPNPYIVGNPVRGRAMFFGRAAEFDLVRRRFLGQTRGSLLVFCGERRSGKTSILFQILDGRLGDAFIPVLIDMQSMAIDDEADFLRKIATEVLGSIGDSASVALPRFTEGSNHAARFRQFIREVLDAYPDKSLILLFDEYELFESKIDAGVLSPDDLHILSNLMENDRVFIIFTGSQDLEARRRDYWRIFLGRSLYKPISYLDRSDALDLIERPLQGVVRYEDGVIETIWRLTAGQPFFTQAVCQAIVDRLNEERTYVVTPAIVDEVTSGLIQNPPPQMIFLWDGLERDEKLVLSLLAETLDDSVQTATADDMRRTLLRREYPLDLDRARVATASESLFRKELLTRNEETEPGFSFRMDLWRRWIRRMHTVWQVMRELGVPIRAREVAPKRRAILIALLSGAVVLAAIVTVLTSRPPRGPLPPPPPGAGIPDARSAWVVLVATPADATIEWNDRRFGIGRFDNPVPGGEAHRFRVAAAGYADSLFEISPEIGDSLQVNVSLRPLLGALQVTTTPPGAEVRLDGRTVGKSPVRIASLSSVAPHSIEASLTGYAVTRALAMVPAERETTVRLALRAGSAELFVTSDPPGARVLVSGTARGTTPVRLAGLPFGRASIGLRREGYSPLDTVAEVTDGGGALHAALRVEPAGSLVLQGDRPARMYVDGRLIVENVQNSRPIELRPGAHAVQVILVSGETIDTSIVVRSGQRATYDYSRRTLRWTSP